jgi:transposase-like protein
MKKHTPEEIIPKLRVADLDWAAGLTIGQVCQKLGVSEQTFHRWRNQCRVLAGVVRERDAPKHIRSDNGPEFITRVMRAWRRGTSNRTRRGRTGRRSRSTARWATSC